jgi:hypothetical protein
VVGGPGGTYPPAGTVDAFPVIGGPGGTYPPAGVDAFEKALNKPDVTTTTSVATPKQSAALKQAQVEMQNIQAAQAAEKAKALEETKKADAATLTMAVGYASMLSGKLEGAGGKTSLAFANEVLGGVEGELGKLDEKGNLLVPAKTTLAFYTTLLGEDFAKTAFGGYKTSLEGSLLIKSVVLGIRGNLQQTTTLNSNDKETALKNLNAEIANMAPTWNQQEVYLAQINSALQPPSKAS